MNQFMQPNIGSQSELRRINRNRVFKFLFSSHSEQNRQSIAEHTSINFPTISRITSEMIKGGLLEEVKSATHRPGRGRKSHKLQIKSNGGFVVGVIISAYAQKIIVGNLSGHIICSLNIEAIFALSLNKIADFLISASYEVIKNAGIAKHKIIGGCIVAPPHMRLSGSNILGPVISKEIVDCLQNELQIPFFATRISNALNVAEHKRGASKQEKNILYSHLSLNVGASVIYNGVLFSETNRLGMIANMPIPNIKPVNGVTPRLHTHASGMGILSQMERASDINITYCIEDCHNLALLLREAEQNGSSSSHYFAEAGKCMGYGLEVLASIFNTDTIVLGGSLSKSSPYMNALLETWNQNKEERTFSIDIRTGDIDIDTATVIAALDGHLNSEHIDLEPLL